MRLEGGKALTMSRPVWLLGPNKTKPSSGRRSMMILKVNHKFARANQEKIRENTLYYIEIEISVIATRSLTEPNPQELGGGRRTCE
jgi:hypothetical protein